MPKIVMIATLIVIFLLATFLRVYQLDSVPPSPSLDEVSIGYNAFSILKTGADEYGNRFPLILRAYDDWRPALYIYLVIPFIQIFGLTVTAVRSPSILLSLATLFLTYKLLSLIASSNEHSLVASEVGTLILAVSPWHIYLSRLGHEVNLGLTLVIAGVYFFILATVQRSGWNLPLSAVFFALSFYSYQSEKIIVPLLLIFLAIIYRDFLFRERKQALFSLLVGVIVSFPIIIATISSPGLIRFQATSAFGDDNPIKIFLDNYLSHFHPKWLFFGAERESHKVPFLGLLYPWEAIFIVLGLIVLRRIEVDRRLKLFLVVWLLISPVPAAITTQAPHAMRSFTFLPVWQIFSALGFLSLYKDFNHTFLRLSLIGILLVFVGWSLTKFYPQYFVTFPKTQSDSFQFALVQAIPYVLSREKEYQTIIFSNQKNLHQSYMFFLFFSKYDPVAYQMEGGTGSGGFAESHSFGKYQFRPINWLSEVHDGNTLYVGNPEDLPEAEAKFTYLDGAEGVRFASK